MTLCCISHSFSFFSMICFINPCCCSINYFYKMNQFTTSTNWKTLHTDAECWLLSEPGKWSYALNWLLSLEGHMLSIFPLGPSHLLPVTCKHFDFSALRSHATWARLMWHSGLLNSYFPLSPLSCLSHSL